MSSENRLQRVFLELLGQAQRRTPGEWVWVQLKHGALVAMRVRPELDHRHELRIARKAETAGDAWEKEVATFLRAWKIEAADGEKPCTVEGHRWWRHHDSHEDGVVETLLLELRRGECKPGRALCFECLVRNGEIREIPWFASGNERGQRCHEHALAAGRAFLAGANPGG